MAIVFCRFSRSASSTSLKLSIAVLYSVSVCVRLFDGGRSPIFRLYKARSLLVNAKSKLLMQFWPYENLARDLFFSLQRSIRFIMFNISNLWYSPYKSSVSQLHMGPNLSSSVDPSERAIAVRFLNVNTMSQIYSRWDRTRENYAVMQISDRERSCYHENEWAAKAACEWTRHREGKRRVWPIHVSSAHTYWPRRKKDRTKPPSSLPWNIKQ